MRHSIIRRQRPVLGRIGGQLVQHERDVCYRLLAYL